MARNLHTVTGYHTWRSPTANQRDTAIDHVLHTPLPPSASIAGLGIVNNNISNALSDHRPVWIALSLFAPLTWGSYYLLRALKSHDGSPIGEPKYAPKFIILSTGSSIQVSQMATDEPT